MIDGLTHVPTPVNEPVRSYAPKSPERAELEAMLGVVASEDLTIPVVAAGERIETGETSAVTMPSAHGERLATLHHARREDVDRAIEGALAAAPAWAAMPFSERAAIFLRAADLLAGPWRARINAACMLGQGKTVVQAEIDAACELIDFLRFNVTFAERIYQEQPSSPPGVWNRSDYRPLEGFVLAVTPFNFLAIAVNLPTAPAIMGNVVLWKPASATAVGAWHMLELLREAGLPDGVISFLPGDGPTQGNAALDSEHLAGIHFTGSTGTFRTLWKGVAERLDRYRAFPRIVGETGGKDFIIAHPSADYDALATAIVRGGFEYQGQKCSAASRVYVPKSKWAELREPLAATIGELRVGDVRDFKCFMSAVIDERAFEKIRSYQQLARDTGRVLAGGTSDRTTGWFIDPTLVEVDDPGHRLLAEEIFGPVVTVYPYDDARWSETLDLVDRTSPYALTGAVFARDRAAVLDAMTRLRNAAGNFYINDKPTGAVVGQQPFGGARGSGTDDKAGSLWNLTRWTAPRSIKETFVPPKDHRYPSMD
jgi:1-pyrroline-5-carboxylate dehydrogenase